MSATRHLRTLGITGDTNAAEILARYRSQVKRWHPDRAPLGREEFFSERMKRVNLARDYLLAHPECWVKVKSEPVISHVSSAVDCSTFGDQVLKKDEAPERSRGFLEWTIHIITTLVAWAVMLYVGLFLFALAGWIITGLLSLAF